MTHEFKPGDVVTLETGAKGEPGYQLAIWKIGDGDALTPEEIRYLINHHGWSIACIDRDLPTRPGTTGIATDADGTTRVIARINDDSMPWESVIPTGLTSDSEHYSDFIETCPYVPADLIRKAEEWHADLGNRTHEGGPLLVAIVEAVRKHREEVERDAVNR